MNQVNKYEVENFKPKFPLNNGHISTVWPTLFRSQSILYTRERIRSIDNDFVDLDWVKSGNSKLILIGHGLEGSSYSTYMVGLAKYAQLNNYDVVAINWRGCSGEPNKSFHSYHSGKSEDLKMVVDHIISRYTYPQIYLAGYSMGGNICLKYSGEMSIEIPKQIKAIVGISVPVDLMSSAIQLAEPGNKMYMNRFLRTLKKKYLQKEPFFSDHKLNTDLILDAKNFLEFDEQFTAPINGFSNALDYWTKSSSKPYLSFITTPTLIINALNDPFLAPKCYPYREVNDNSFIQLLTPEHGGHVGFIESPFDLENTWVERQIIRFFDSV